MNDSETNVTDVISFILKKYRNEKVKQNLDVTSELILISRILYQRFQISNGIKVKEDKSLTLVKNEILKEIKDDDYYGLINKFISGYRQFRDRKLN
jgi:hypothetical protein|tara:strand:- start:327 stop:614 length:288 start_codon:yes stop_codon:yes gene_type:complete